MWKKQFAAVFLDMDGALLDSGNHAQQVWMQWAQQHGIDEALLGEQIHSQRVQEIVRRLAPHLDTQQEVHALEAALLQMTQRHQSQLQQGVSELLQALGETPWGVVTQSHHARAEEQLQQAGMQRPPLVVGAEQVSSGRPDPEPYLLAASFYGVDPRDCLVFESDEAGIKAAQAAGMTVIAITNRHQRHHLQRADVVISGWRSIILHPQRQGIVIEVVA